MARQEIEVKACVTNQGELLRKLEELGVVLGEALEQKDTWYVNFDEPYDGLRLKENFLRIRLQGDGAIFSLKQPQTNDLDVIEYNTEITNPQQMHEAILMLGYHEVVRVNKQRRTGNYQNYEICLDEIEGLGTYIEVEQIAEGVDSAQAQIKLFEFLQRLGVNPDDREVRGYDLLVWLQQRG